MEDQKPYTDDLVRSGEFVQTFLSKNAVVTLAVYQKFWSTLPYKSNPSLYLTCLITKLCALETGEDKNMSLVEMITRITQESSDNSTIDDPKQVQQMKESLLCSIYLVNLMYPIDTSYPPLKNALARWATYQSKSKPLDFNSELLSHLSTGLESENWCIILVEQCSNVEALEVLDPQNTSQHHVSGFAHAFLLDCIIRGKHIKVIWQTIIKFVKHRNITPKRLLALLLIMKTILKTCPVVDVGLLETGLNSIKEYYHWSSPYGDIVREMLYLLSIELQLPGHSFRTRLLSENPHLIQLNLNPSSSSSSSSSSINERNTHLLLDETSKDGKVIQEILRSEFEEELSVYELQTDHLAHILERYLLTPRDLLGLEYCSRDDTKAFLKSACEVLNKSLSMNDEEGSEYRIRELNNVREQIIDKTSSKRRKSIELFTTLPKVPKMPPLSLQFFNAKCDNIEPLQLEINKFPHRNTAAVLTHILNQYLMSVSTSDTTEKKEVKIGLMGGDSLIHNITSSYSVLRLNQPKYFDYVDIKFYLIPCEESSLSKYLCKKDPWYFRQVYLLSQCILKIYPTVSVNPSIVPIPAAFSNDSVPEKPKTTGIQLSNLIDSARNWQEMVEQFELYEQIKPRKYLSPSLILRREMERYFRDANETLKVNLFQCECWSDEKGDSSYIIPFFSRAEIGINAQTKAFHLSPVSSSLTESQVLKYFKYVPPVLSVKFTIASFKSLGSSSVTTSGGGGGGGGVVSKAGPPIEVKPYQSIVISNLPSFDDPFPIPPNPCEGWLEVCLIDSEYQKRKKIRGDDGRIYHVNTIDISSEDKKKFEIILDGELYGPFSKIKIGPCTQEDEQVSLPIMTYFPTNISS